MVTQENIIVNHALLFSSCVRSRRYIAAFAARNSPYFSSQLIHQAFREEADDTVKSWLALALGNLGYHDSRKDISNWGGTVESGNENQYWGVIASNLISTDQNFSKVQKKIISSDEQTIISGLIGSYHHPIKTNVVLKAIEKSLLSGSGIKERWALVTISNSKNFTRWDLVFDLLKNSENSATREWSAWAISAAFNQSFDSKLIKIIEQEKNPRVREWLYKALAVNNNSLNTSFLGEMFLNEKDFMIREGIVQSMLYCNSRSIVKKWIECLFEASHSIITPEHEILVSQSLKVFYSVSMNIDELNGLVKIAETASDSLKFSIYSIIKYQLKDLTESYRLGTYQKIGELLSQEEKIFKEIFYWDTKISKIIPITISEKIIQQHSGNVAGGVFQRATIISNDSQNIRVSQQVEDALVGGDIIQSITY